MTGIALIGQQLIHTYPLIPRFNGCDIEKVQQYAPGWVEKAALTGRTRPISDAVRVTRVWSPDRSEAERLAESLFIEKVCASLDEALEQVDGVLVMDEVVESRTELVGRCIRAGLTVYADKVLSVDPAQTDELLALAEANHVRVRSGSQLYFHPDLARIREAPAGGVGFLNFKMGTDILAMYGIHVISMLQGGLAAPVRAYRPLVATDCRAGLVTLTDGTRVFLYVGQDLPFRGRFYYCAEDTEVIVNRHDDAGCFDNLARALTDLFTGREMPGPGPDRMREASRLLEIVVAGGSDAKEVLLGP